MLGVTKRKLVVLGIATLISGHATAGEITSTGQVCWNGKTKDSMSTEKGTVAFTYEVAWVFTSSDKDPTKAATGKCLGVISVRDGKRDWSVPNFCTHILAEGTYMSKGDYHADGKGQTRTYYAGTGKYKGVSGKGVGGPAISLKAGKGEFAGCRDFKAELTVPDS